MNIIERKAAFELELKALLVKFDCELCIEDFGRNWDMDDKIVVDFQWGHNDFSGLFIPFCEQHNAHQWIIGTFLDGK